jgi:hypothetical protein
VRVIQVVDKRGKRRSVLEYSQSDMGRLAKLFVVAKARTDAQKLAVLREAVVIGAECIVDAYEAEGERQQRRRRRRS